MVCPHCELDLLTKKEKLINKLGNIESKVVCKNCRLLAIKRYYDHNNLSYQDFTVSKYLELPKYYKFNVVNFFKTNKG